VPDAFWPHVFLTDDPTAAAIWGPLVGPLVAVISFMCSIGNVPLAVVLWTGGMSFGGVVAFLFADLIILPILTINLELHHLAQHRLPRSGRRPCRRVRPHGRDVDARRDER
jgi:uncharacterized membrane protein YraQ (UPF0718 family)